MAMDSKQVYAESKGMFGQVPEWIGAMPDSAIGGTVEWARAHMPPASQPGLSHAHA